MALRTVRPCRAIVLQFLYMNLAETCWYPSKIESGEAEEQDTLGQHLIEAHWKYFTIDVRDAYECDKAAHLHYEFLLHRCQPKHYLPVLSVYRLVVALLWSPIIKDNFHMLPELLVSCVQNPGSYNENSEKSPEINQGQNIRVRNQASVFCHDRNSCRHANTGHQKYQDNLKSRRYKLGVFRLIV